MSSKYEIQNMLESFIEETKMKLDKIEQLLGEVDSFEVERAKNYWIAHIRTALDDDHDYLGGSMVTAENTMNALDNV